MANFQDNLRTDVLHLFPSSANSILEIGGGTGVTAAEAKKICGASTAGVVDLSEEAIRNAKPELDFAISGDLGDLSVLEDVAAKYGPFDLILCLDILEHLVDPWKTVAKLDSMLAPGGVIVASIPNVRYYHVSLRLVLRGSWNLSDSGILDRTHLRFFTRKTAISLMACSGLTIKSVSARYHPRRGRSSRIFNALTLGLFKELLDFQYFIVAQKA